MAQSPDQLWNTLDRIEKSLLSIVDDFDKLSQASIAYNGDIAKVLPVQLNASADSIRALVDGAGQNSIKNLKEYVDNIPLGDFRTKSAAEAVATGAPRTNVNGDTGNVDLTPKTQGPQSAIAQANEDVDLTPYMKKNHVKESINDDGEFNFDAICADTGVDGGIKDEADFDFEDAMLDSQPVADVYDNPVTDDEDKFDFDDFENKRLEDGADPSADLGWQDAYDYGDNI